MPKILIAHKNLDERTAWVERAAWEASRVVAEAGIDAQIVDWGADKAGDNCWLNIDSGELNFDLAISHEFFDYRVFTNGEGEERLTMKQRFLYYVRRAKPGLFTQCGVGRHMYGLDLESDNGVDVRYTGDRPFRDFSAELAREQEEEKRKLAEWEEAEKARKARATAKE